MCDRPASIQIHEAHPDEFTARMWHTCGCVADYIAAALGEPHSAHLATREALESLVSLDVPGMVTVGDER